MAPSKAIEDAINTQINSELYSSYLYLAMSAYCEAETLPGFAQWLKVQAQEETGHALKLMEYLADRGGRVRLQGIQAPPLEYGTPAEMFQQILEHEQKVTASINSLYALAAKENDFATQAALQWFITEQVEEEKVASELAHQLKKVEGSASGVLYYDRHMAKRE